jgi:hypothetical protein
MKLNKVHKGTLVQKKQYISILTPKINQKRIVDHNKYIIRKIRPIKSSNMKLKPKKAVHKETEA